MKGKQQKKIRILLAILIWITIIATYMTSRYWYYKTKKEIIDYISQQTFVREVEKEPEIIFIEREQMDYTKFFNTRLDVENIMQLPELPTGCEVTSLAIILNYLGYDIDKVTLSDSFLPKGEPGETNPNDAFIGDPKTSIGSYGANAPVLVQTANDYLDYMSSNYNAYNVSTEDFSSLLKYINDGYPVMVWATMGLEASYPTEKWVIDNEEVQWYANEHCMVLIGYTPDYYIFADPLKEGIIAYDRGLVEQRYNELGNQAVVIY